MVRSTPRGQLDQTGRLRRDRSGVRVRSQAASEDLTSGENRGEGSVMALHVDCLADRAWACNTKYSSKGGQLSEAAVHSTSAFSTFEGGVVRTLVSTQTNVERRRSPIFSQHRWKQRTPSERSGRCERWQRPRCPYRWSPSGAHVALYGARRYGPQCQQRIS